MSPPPLPPTDCPFCGQRVGIGGHCGNCNIYCDNTDQAPVPGLVHDGRGNCPTHTDEPLRFYGTTTVRMTNEAMYVCPVCMADKLRQQPTLAQKVPCGGWKLA